jgi:predicted small lipoprotein YifL
MQSRLQLCVVGALLVLGALSLAGCGVRGSLEAPPGEKAETGNAIPGNLPQPGAHRPMILDPLLR